jgi:hypothetical protein
MSALVIIALIIAIPVMIFPAAFVWYINVSGIFASLREARARKAEKELAKQK